MKQLLWDRCRNIYYYVQPIMKRKIDKCNNTNEVWSKRIKIGAIK